MNAVSVTISGLPASIDRLQEVELSVLLECSGCQDSFLRGVFYKGESTTYVGYTKNNEGAWINGSDKSQYFKIAETDLIEGSWSGKLAIKFDPEKDIGTHNFKVIRYTGSGNNSGTSDSVSIEVVGPSMTPTSTPSPSPTVTQPQATYTPTRSPTPTIVFSPTSRVMATPTPMPNATGVSSSTDSSTQSGELLGMTTISIQEKIGEREETLSDASVSEGLSLKQVVAAVVLLGGVFSGAGSIIAWVIIRRQLSKKKDHVSSDILSS